MYLVWAQRFKNDTYAGGFIERILTVIESRELRFTLLSALLWSLKREK